MRPRGTCAEAGAQNEFYVSRQSINNGSVAIPFRLPKPAHQPTLHRADLCPECSSGGYRTILAPRWQAMAQIAGVTHQGPTWRCEPIPDDPIAPPPPLKSRVPSPPPTQYLISIHPPI